MQHKNTKKSKAFNIIFYHTVMAFTSQVGNIIFYHTVMAFTSQVGNTSSEQHFDGLASMIFCSSPLSVGHRSLNGLRTGGQVFITMYI